jgi:hypothetical protein
MVKGFGSSASPRLASLRPSRTGEVLRGGAWYAPPLPLPRHGKPCLFPGGHSPFKGLGVGVPHLEQSRGLTGRAAFLGSGAIEHDFLVLRQGGPEGLKLSKRDGFSQLMPLKFGLIIVSTDQERFS